jgi:type IV pilus assembly protein PilW
VIARAAAPAVRGRRTQWGGSLVELMLGLMLGLSVVGVALGAFSSVSRTANSQNSAAIIAETAQAAGGYLGKQLLQAGYVDLMANADNSSHLFQLDNFGAAQTQGSGDMLAAVHALSHPGLRSIHGCNSGYVKVDDLLDYDCGAAATPLAGSLSIAYQALATPNGWQAPSLATAFDLTRGYRSDCGARSPRAVDNALADPPGDVVMNRYYLDTDTLQLMCVGNGNPDAPIRIAGNVEQFQVLYALPQPNPGGAESVAQYVTADVVNALGPAAWGTVLTVRVCLLIRGEPGSGDGGTTLNVFSRDCAGNPTSMADGRMRRAHQFVMTVRNAVRSAVALP